MDKEVPALKIRNVCKSFGSFEALNRVTLDIFSGQFFSLLGPSGCGKTTLLRIIAGLEEPNEGEIYLKGRPIVIMSEGFVEPPDKRNMGMVFQSYAVWPHMSVYDNIAYPLRLRSRRIKREEIKSRVGKALEMVGLSGVERRLGTELSGGQQQRVALARAIIYNPDVLLLDEPFSNLDAHLREEMRKEMLELQKQLGITVILVTHDQEEALAMSDQIAVIAQGSIQQIGSPQELYRNPKTEFIRDFLGKKTLLPGTVREIASAGDVGVRVLIQVEHVALFSIVLNECFVEAGQHVHISVRPEHVSIVGDAQFRNEQEDVNVCQAEVRDLQYIGSHFNVGVELKNGQRLHFQTAESFEMNLQKSIKLRIQSRGPTIWSAN